MPSKAELVDALNVSSCFFWGFLFGLGFMLTVLLLLLWYETRRSPDADSEDAS